jgi:hypothetical protein
MPVAGTKFHFLQRLHENGPRNGPRARPRASCGGVVRSHGLSARRCPRRARSAGLLAAARGCPQPGTGSGGSARLLDAGWGPGISPSESPTCSRRRSAWIPTRPCSPKLAKAAHQRGITNIGWVQALAEDLPGAAPGPTEWVASASPSTGWTKPVSPRPWTTGWRPAAPWPDRPHRPGTTRTTEPGPPPIPHPEIKALVEK